MGWGLISVSVALSQTPAYASRPYGSEMAVGQRVIGQRYWMGHVGHGSELVTKDP